MNSQNQNSVVKVKNLKKTYTIFDRPSDRLKDLLFPWTPSRARNYEALLDISFEIKSGEFVGILGRNGAGKSTLLKILSRSLQETSGEISIQGKVALLQLGVGFDSEMSGLENARFASKLLGYSDEEVEQMLPGICNFAEIGEFINHPVKTYSSGMYSRLSFAVAVNINPDILIADEVLSVGDIRFSQKCLRKMQEFKDSGKTVILVTHDTTIVSVFCDKALWLLDGKIFRQGEAKEVAEEYKNYMLYDKLPHTLPNEILSNPSEVRTDSGFISEVLTNKPQITDGSSKILKAWLQLPDTDSSKNSILGNSKIQLNFQVLALQDLDRPCFGYVAYDTNGIVAFHSNNEICNGQVSPIAKNQQATVTFEIQLPNINKNQFIFAISVGNNDEMLTRVHDILPISVDYKGPKANQKGYYIIDKESFHLTIENK